MKNISLCVLIVLLLNFNASIGQNILEKNIEEVTVISNRSQYNKEFKIVHTIDSEEIKNSSNQTIADILEFAINVCRRRHRDRCTLPRCLRRDRQCV